MKSTKFLLPFLLCVGILVVSSCNPVEYRPTGNGNYFLIKKVDGKRQWGMGTMVRNQPGTWGEEIPCQYDSIFSICNAPYHLQYLYVAIKDGQRYLWNDGDLLLGGRSFTRLYSSYWAGEELVPIAYRARHSESTYGCYGSLYAEAHTEDGIIFLNRNHTAYFEVGPAEAIFDCQNVILYKKGGKWGVYNSEIGGIIKEKLIDCVYDEIICVNLSYYWGKKDGKWSAFDENGKTINKSRTLLNKYLQMPSMSDDEYLETENSALFRKKTIEKASYIAIDPWNQAYIEY